MAQPTDAPRSAPSTPPPPTTSEDPSPAVRSALSDAARPEARRTINALLGR